MSAAGPQGGWPSSGLTAERLPALVAELIRAVASLAADAALAELRSSGESTTWPRWMSVETAAQYLDISVERLRKLVARGRIPFVQEGPGCRVFFDRTELDAWMRRQRVAARVGPSWQ